MVPTVEVKLGMSFLLIYSGCSTLIALITFHTCFMMLMHQKFGSSKQIKWKQIK